MNPRSSFRRKIVYLVVIAGLLLPLSCVATPATRDTQRSQGSPGGGEDTERDPGRRHVCRRADGGAGGGASRSNLAPGEAEEGPAVGREGIAGQLIGEPERRVEDVVVELGTDRIPELVLTPADPLLVALNHHLLDLVDLLLARHRP